MKPLIHPDVPMLVVPTRDVKPSVFLETGLSAGDDALKVQLDKMRRGGLPIGQMAVLKATNGGCYLTARKTPQCLNTAF